MSLRARLAMVLAAVLLGPVLAGALAVGLLGPRASAAAGRAAAVRDAGSVAVALADRCRAVGDLAAQVAGEVAVAAQPTGALSDVASTRIAAAAAGRRPGTAVVVLDPGGTAHAASGTEVADLGAAGRQAAVSRVSSCSQGTPADATSAPVLADNAPVFLGSTGIGSVVVWTPLDDAALRAVRTGVGAAAQVALVDPRSVGVPDRLAAGPPVVTSTTSRSSLDPVLRAIGDGDVAGTADRHPYALRDPAPGLPYAVLAVSPARGTALLPVLIGLVAASAVVAVAVVRVLARRLTAPLADLTATADRLGAGDLSARSSVEGRDEVGRLAAALDLMAARLQSAVGELHAQQDALSDTFGRFGEALGHTHDLDGLLGTVVEAARRGCDGTAGVVLLAEPPPDLPPSRDDTGGPGSLATSVRLAERARALDDGAAGATAQADALHPLAARAAELGDAVQPEPVRGGGPALALPLLAGGRVLGAIAVARDAGAVAFDEPATARVRALAAHAGTAIANVRLHEETRRLSVTDPLTGAGNLRQLSTTLSREVERATRFDRPLTVLMLDLDHFKEVNDSLGHAFGDLVLREFARRLAGCLREVDTVARYGGEEFSVILPETDTEGGARVAERVLDAVRSQPFRAGEASREVTVSAGVASFPAHGRSAAEVLRSADTALYAAKRAGRDQWRVAGVQSGTLGTAQAG